MTWAGPSRNSYCVPYTVLRADRRGLEDRASRFLAHKAGKLAPAVAKELCRAYGPDVWVLSMGVMGSLKAWWLVPRDRAEAGWPFLP